MGIAFHTLQCIAFVAQGLEHWSCKPGVESSNLSEGFCIAPPLDWIATLSWTYRRLSLGLVVGRP